VHYPFPPLDFSQTRTYPLGERTNKVHLADLARPYVAGSGFAAFFEGLPRLLAGAEVHRLVEWWARAVHEQHLVLLLCGAHVIKVGLSPILIDLMDRGALSALVLNGAGAIHDTELAMGGATSEDVAAGIQSGRFGMVTETGEFLNAATRLAAREGMGLGQAVGQLIDEHTFIHRELSVLWQAWKRRIPVMVMVSPGADIHHTHPTTDGAQLGAATFHDFRLLCGVVSRLRAGSLVMNVGSAVVLPVILEKALAVARNHGHPVEGFMGVNLDFIQHYRANNNPVARARELGGEGISLTGHHELMVPLLHAALVEALARPRASAQAREVNR
jgi:hypothetical protein